ncbi:MAG: hypothetical protein HY696_08630 [Deltaproteobacteria bacterium]|nr:hypothetical protein [Deltaproteobacteria bacterium]
MLSTTLLQIGRTLLRCSTFLGIVGLGVAQAAEQQISGNLSFFDERDAALVPFPLPDDHFRPLANVPYAVVIKQGGKQKIVGYGITHTNGAIIHQLEIQKAKNEPATLTLLFTLQNNLWRMKDVLGKPYQMQSAALPFNPTQSGALDFGAMAPVYGTLSHQAAHVFTSVEEAWMYGTDGGWTQDDPLTVIWPNYKIAGGKIVTDPSGNPLADGMSNASASTMRINFSKWLDDHGTIYHEYGHVIQQRLVTIPNPGYCWVEAQATNYTEGDGCWHNTESQEYPAAAFIEGWADFYEYSVANYVLPEYNDNAYVMYVEAETRTINPLDDTNEGNVAAVLVDLLDTAIDSHAAQTEHFQIKPITTGTTTTYYYDFTQTLLDGTDQLGWTFSGLLAVLAHLNETGVTQEVGIEAFIAELRTMCVEQAWACAEATWDEHFDQLAQTSWVNLQANTAPTPYPW